MDKKEVKKITIKSEYITLGQFLKFVDLIDNGAMAKFFLKEHQVKINDEPCDSRGKKLYPSFFITIDNQLFFEIIK